MSGSPQAPVQAAMYGRLTGDDLLRGLLQADDDNAGVYDEPPETAVYPRIDLGEATEIPDNVLAELGWETTHTLHIWTKAKSNKAGLAILNRVCELFNKQPLEVAGYHFVSMSYEFSQTLRDPVPGIRHIPARFRVSTEQE